MTEPLSRWEMKRYSYLWDAFKKRSFTDQEAQKVLREKRDHILNGHILSTLFNDLKKVGLIEIKTDKKDRRKKIYKLKERPSNS